MRLGETIQARLKESLDAEIAFYAGRGLITREEQELIADTYLKSTDVASKALPLKLAQRDLNLPQAAEKNLTDKIEGIVEDVMVKLGVKATYDSSSWSGSASQWKTAEAYCASCLIDMNTGGSPKTKDKCKLPYKKPGSSAINKNALRAMASGGRGLPALKGVPKSEIVKAANFMIRHWQGAFDKPAPANIYRLAGKTPPKGSKESQVQFLKDKSGQWWMLGLYSNRWMDREREILSEASHKEYAEWLNKSGFKPQVTFYHLPKAPEGFWEKVWDKWGNNVTKLNEIVKGVYKDISIGEVERIVYLNGFSIAVAKIYPEKIEVAKKLAESEDVGMSHGFLAMQMSDPDDFSLKDTINIIEKYRSFEVSILLRERAANYGTAPFFVEDKAVTFSDKDREFLDGKVPASLLEALDDNTKESEEFMNAVLEQKELNPDFEETPETPQDDKAAMPDEEEEDEEEDMEKEDKAKVEDKQEETPQPEAESKEVENVHEIIEAVKEALAVDQLQDVLKAILEKQNEQATEIAALKEANAKAEAEVKSLKQSEDEKIASAYTPMNWGGIGYSPSKSDTTAIPEETSSKMNKNGPSTEAPSTTGDEVLDHFLNSIKRK